jgi:hypothetical protein
MELEIHSLWIPKIQKLQPRKMDPSHGPIGWKHKKHLVLINHTANQADDQASLTAASQFPATDSNLPKEQVQSALQDVQSSKSSQTGITMQIKQARVSAPGSTSRTAPAAPRNLVPNMHQVSSHQSTVSSVSSVSSVQSSSVQSSVSAPPGKSSGLTAAYEASSMKKLLLMQSQLKLNSKQYALEVQDWLEAKEDRKAKRDGL